ncbi:putative Zn finger protein [Nocardiopsis mwathae]|uniref:Putative Zn finger protein n=1 Tax=Nocardiopsis mwathae TaxID=1472723 RepID=A0A7X0D7S9_9ACTN|nr:SWIM zinc finger family protein [Nocardiopsis mwathae]MBB6174665.1 putative Zn finger protein [Nocardiopsis mwathae]
MRARGPVGDTWWGHGFVRGFASFGDPGRFSRGRTYARNGSVQRIDLEPGLARARVSGSRATPYRVTVHCEPVEFEVWERVAEALAESPGAAEAVRRLEEGELPVEVEEAFAAAGVELFPVLGEMTPSCSCPDWGYPCKHAAAVLYAMADFFDSNPAAFLAWRGCVWDELVAALEAFGSGADRPRGALEIEAAPLADRVTDFWAATDPVPLPGPPRPFAPLEHWADGIPALQRALSPVYDAMVAAETEDDDTRTS